VVVVVVVDEVEDEVVLPRPKGSSCKQNAMITDSTTPPVPTAMKFLETVDPNIASAAVINIIPLRLEVDMMPQALPC
jgi:hypothetical protein